jgi:small subunit ribosomal protein S2
MVVVDPAREANAVKEARKMGLVVIGVLDTDCDPTGIDIVIPGNDDALKSVRLILDNLVRSVEEGAANHRERMATTGAAEKHSDEPAQSGDEPRPTGKNRMPETMTGRFARGRRSEATGLSGGLDKLATPAPEET